MNTKIKRILAILSIAAITINSTYAATQIGTGSVTGNAGFNTNIMWNDLIPGTASGTVNGIVVTAKVLPTLNMVISTGGINLGNLNSTTYSTGFLDIEVGTNAANGVTVTAKSGTGGLRSTAVNGQVINSLVADGIQESYRFTSALSGAVDSTIAGYTRTANLSAGIEVIDNTTNHILFTSNDPESSSGSSDVTFFVSARANSQTPAALNYTDTISLTVTGNF